MYTSSSLTLFYRYYLPLVMISFLALIYLTTDISIHEMRGLLILPIGYIPAYFLIFGKLRHVKAMHEKLITTTMNYEEEIQYEHIEYVYQSALASPVFIKISYRDEQGKSCKFYTIGSNSEQAFRIDPFRTKELQLTQFIRRKVKAAQPAYAQDAEPSRWNIALILLCCMIMMILAAVLIENF